jgi:hypothetical protein
LKIQEYETLHFDLIYSSCQHGAIGQETSLRVLCADSSSIVGNQLNVLDELYEGDIVTSYGTLILIHRTGKLVEIKGDTSVNISELSQAILQTLDMRSCDNEWPYLERLFKTSRVRTGAVTAGLPDIKWVFPNDRISANPRQNVVLIWDPYEESAQEFELQFKTIFDDLIGEPYKWHQNRLVLPLDTFKLSEDLQYLLIDVRVANDQYMHGAQVGIEFSETSHALPDTFEANTAIKALEIAFHLELNGGWEYATSYFELAAELSEHPFYQQMLTTHLKRSAR